MTTAGPPPPPPARPARPWRPDGSDIGGAGAAPGSDLSVGEGGSAAGVRRRLGAAFEREAGVYAAHRPGYPGGAVAWLVGRERRSVLDLGAGSGSLTDALVSAGHEVVAGEPSHAMLAELAARGFDVPLVRSGAEALPFAPGSFDVVTVATAFHWFDAAVALPQVAAVLKPGGRLALVWNIRSEADDWAAELGELLRAAQPPALAGHWATDSVRAVQESTLFGQMEAAEFPFTQTLDRAGLVGLAASRSYVIALSSTRRRRLLESVGRLFDSAAGADARVELPYTARCWRSERLAGPAPHPHDPAAR